MINERRSRSAAKPGLAFVRRALLPRAIGLGVGCIAVGGVLWGQGEPSWLWGMLLVYCYVWPLVAFQIAWRSREPYAAEQRHVLLDSLMGGFWIATIGYNTLPTVMMLSMLAMNNTAAGGARFVFRGFGLQLLGMAASAVLLGVRFSPATSMQQVYASLPMLVIHPMTIGLVLYGLAIQLGKHKRALREVSRTDSLTNLFNRGYWRECLQHEFEQSCQLQQPAALALIDVDHFKLTNDQHGHVAGDSVLRTVGERIRANLRLEDLAGRYGGDEFCICLPQTTPELAHVILERLRGEVAALRFEHAPQLRVSLSIGVAGHSLALADATAWLQEADRALYEAKRQGRNRIVLAPREAVDVPA